MQAAVQQLETDAFYSVLLRASSVIVVAICADHAPSAHHTDDTLRSKND